MATYLFLKRLFSPKIKSTVGLWASFRALIFIIFYFLCLRQLIVFYNIIPRENHWWVFLLFFLFLLLAIFRNVWALYGIFITVPLFTGLEILRLIYLPFPIYSLLFSSFFLFWFPSRLIKKQRRLVPRNRHRKFNGFTFRNCNLFISGYPGPFPAGYYKILYMDRILGRL